MVNCSLSQTQVENLYKLIYKQMLNSLESNEAFAPEAFMTDLFEKIQKKTDVNTASTFLQIVPTLMKNAVEQDEIDTSDFDFDLNANKELITKFRNTENGLLETLKHFRPEATLEDLEFRMEIEKGILNTPLSDQGDEFLDMLNDPFRWQADDAFTSTMQEFSPRTPDEKDTGAKEKKDPNKKRIYRTIRTIKEKGVRKEGGPELIYQGKVLKLKTVKLTSLAAAGLLDATTAKFVEKSNAIVKQGDSLENVTPAKDIIALVISDEDGKQYYYFDENGNISTKEDGGQIVYQFLRDVRPEENSDKLRVTDIYGLEDRILSPTELIEKDAHNSKMSMPEYKKWLIDQGTTYEDFLELVDNKQQKTFKELQDLRDEVRAGQDKLLNITDISTGIVDIFYNKEKSTLKELLTATKKTAEEFRRLIGINPTTFRAEILINDVNYEIDRTNLPEEYINQIAAVLVNPKLNNKQKNDFYLQFTHNTINAQTTRKLFVNYYENTGILTAGYRPDPKTNKQLIPITLTDSNAEQIIIDSLLKESPPFINEKGETIYFSTNMSYNKDIIADNKTFYNYNRNTGKFNAVDYSEFLLSLDLKILNPADKKTNKGDAVNNPYFQFRIDKDFIAETEEIKEEVKSNPVDRIKAAKDDLVLKLKANKDLSGTILSGMSKTNATFLMKVDSVTVEGRYESGVSSNDVNLNDPVTFIVNDISPKIKNVVSIYKGDKKIGQVSETDFTLKPKVTKAPGTPQQEAAKKDEPFINPTKVSQPDEESNIPFKLNEEDEADEPFELDRSSKLPNNVTQEEITAAQEWWDNSPLSKLIKLEHMANIVNSDVYARFIIAGKRLSDVSIQLDTATGGTAVDLYHEAWHAFSQLYLTKSQKTKLYAETRKRLNNYELSPEEVEEIIAEDFREYAKNPKAVGDAPIRNTIFRRIWNFIKTLFGKRSIQEDLFERLYFASKNPKLLNKYTPLVDNHMFNKLNRARGVFNTETKELVLNYQDSLKVSTQIDSVLSRIIDEEYDDRLTDVINNVKDKAGKLVTANKTGTIQILTVEANKIKAYARTKKRFNAKLAEFKTELEATTQEDFNKRSLLNNKIRILETAIVNWDNVLEFHKEHSTFDLIKQKYIEIDEEESETEGDTTAPEVVEETEKFSDKKVGEKSLIQLAEKETLYILKSLFKIVDGKEVEGSLGFPELVDFSKIWNTVTKVIGGEKDPVKMYLKLQAAVPFYPELGQLVNKKFPDPRNIKTLQEFNIKAAFWQDFKKPLIRYVQLTVGIDEETDDYKSEVTDASIEFKNIINSFKSAFNSSAETKYISKGTNNKSTLKLDVLMKTFPDAASIGLPAQQIEFVNALGVGLQDLISIKDELTGKSREYGIPYIHQIAKEVYTLNKDPKLTNDKQKEFIKKFIDNPIDALYGKIPAGIHENINSQKSVIQKLARLQNKFGNNYASFSVLNAEKKLVNEFTEDSTVTMTVDAINNVEKGRDLWMNPEYSYMSYLNPLINGFTEQSQLLKSIFKVEENTWDRKKDARLDLVMVSGTQIVNVDGANTTSLDIHGKYIQELNMMLKSGFQEFMRHASKSASFGMKSTKIKNLYVDIDQFKPGGDADQYAVDNIFLGYIQAELIRIQKIRANKEEYKKYVGYNREIKSADGETVLGIAGEFFTAFDNILTKVTKEEIIEKVKNGKLLDYLESDPKLKADITEQVSAYFERQSADNKKDFQKSKWIDPALTKSLKKFELSTDDEETMLIKAHTMNAWIHNFETASLIYGDVVQYNHAKQELHKRNPGSTSGGRGFMTDDYTQNFLNSDLIKGTSYGAKLAAMDDFGSEYTPFSYSRTYNTAIMQEVKRSSVYIKNIEKGLREDYTRRGLSQSEIDYRLKKELKPYKEMEEGDGQGYITIDAYRLLRLAEKNWSSEQEDLFQKVISGKEISTEDITQIFPVYKLQNFGHLANTSLPVNAMHKFALMPLIPSLIAGSDLESLHHQMMKSNIQYATFQSGSKVGSITSQVDKNGKAVADQIYDDNGAQKTLKSDIKFTKNTIYLAYLKNVTSVPVKLKGKTIFATQLRKLILEGLYENGKLVNKKYTPFVKAYEDAVNGYTEILKTELLNEIGYEYKDGKYVSGDLTKFMDVVQRELTRKDLPEHLIDYIQVGSNNVLTKDLSLHMLSGDIEKMITSLVEKRIVKQKVKGEALVQVASSMTNGLWDSGFKFEKAQVAEIEKYLGTNNLPFYNPGENGNTSAMKVAIALQGDFKNLLKLKDLDGVEIGTRKRLNELIKDDKWLNKGNNRKSVTLSAVRIPVQGMNSMEFMEVYEFLDPAAGSMIILPSEIVAKSGADYDVDKLTTFMPNIDEDGNYVTSNISEETLKKLIANAESKGDKAEVVKLIALQKKAIENRLIDSIRGILQLPDNYATLVRPNETYLMKDIADDLVDLLPEYGRYKTISPTNVFEVGYNLAKHDYNMTGKDVLGIIALENALHPVYTALGAALPKTYYGSVKNPKTKKYEDDKSIIYEMRLLLDHNKTEDGRISLSGINSEDGQDKIADLFSHLMNGSVDVEKDAWIFFIQANKELIPMLLNLLKAGVPKRDAVYFISQPLVREYANQQRLYDGVYSNLTGKETLSDENKKYNALLNVLKQTDISESIYKANRTRLSNAIKGYNKEAKVSVKLSGTDKSYNTTLKSLIADVKADKVKINDIELINSSETGPLFKSIIADPNNEFYHPMSTPNYKDVVLAATEGMDKFTTADLKETMTNNDTTSPKAIAIFLHYLEYEKQIKDMSDLKRQSNPDTATSKTIQEIMQRKIGLDILSESSKIDQDLVRKLRKESILGSFFDNVITQDLVEPIFPLTNDKRVSAYLLNYIKNNNIPLKFGEGADGITNFITSFKQAMVNYIYQNRLNEIITTKESFPGVPELFSTLNHQAYVTRFMSMISENSHLKELYSVLEQITDVPVNIFNSKNFSIKDQVFDAKTKKLTIKGQISVLTLNNKPVVKGALADSYHQNLIDLADENIIKVKDPVKNKKISDMFKILPLISILQNGVGNTKYGLSYVLPDTTYFEIVEPASREFIANKMNTSTFDKIAAMMIANDPNVNNYIDDSIIFKATEPSTSVKREYTPENITTLKPNEVFVFGSNTEGRHGKGAAKTAVDNFGAKYGQAEGPQGQSYAIVTKNLKEGDRSNNLDSKSEYNALDYIDKQIGDFIAYATKNPNKKFYVTKLGTMLAGWTTKEIGEIWNNQGIIPNNIILPKEFEDFVDPGNREISTQPSTSVEEIVYDNNGLTIIENGLSEDFAKSIVPDLIQQIESQSYKQTKSASSYDFGSRWTRISDNLSKDIKLSFVTGMQLSGYEITKEKLDRWVAGETAAKLGLPPYGYNTLDQYGNPLRSIPSSVIIAASNATGLDLSTYQASYNSVYDNNDQGNLIFHQDNTEQITNAPIVTLSLGLPMKFIAFELKNGSDYSLNNQFIADPTLPTASDALKDKFINPDGKSFILSDRTVLVFDGKNRNVGHKIQFDSSLKGTMPNYLPEISVNKAFTGLNQKDRYVKTKDYRTVLTLRKIKDDGVAIKKFNKATQELVYKNGVYTIINKSISTQQQDIQPTTNIAASEYTNHSGGAALSDAEWDQIGREFGVVNHKHYREPLDYIDTKGQPAKGFENLDSKKLQAAGIEPTYINQKDYDEGAAKATQAFRMMFEDAGNKSVRSAYIIRNWMQVKNADAVYALGTIKQPGENASDKTGETRIAAVPIVKGGTGYAVQMAINEGKPVYVFDGTKEGWYTYDYKIKNFVPTETPTLTKNFAGIGSRTLSTQEVIDKSLQAIRDVYANTFKATTQPSTDVNSNDIYSQLENKNVVISNIKTKDGKYDRDANITEAKANNRVYTMEVVSDVNSFSNPWASFNRTGTIKTNSTKEAVINYIDWLTTDKFKDVKSKRKTFILDVLKSGKLKGRQLQYYAKLGEPSHATALDYLINKYDWNTQSSTSVKEGVAELFESNPELAKIGTPAQYSAYLDTIFPDSKVKDIVYRGGEKEDSRLFQYFTKNSSEAYIYSKANITKGGNITERNPIPSIYNQAKKYLDNKYGQGNAEILLSEDDFAAVIIESLNPDYLDLNYNFTQKGQEYYNELQKINNKKKELLKTIDKKDVQLLNSITTVTKLYDAVKIESENDLTKPYDDTNYQDNIEDYNKARKYIDDVLEVANIRKDIGKITANVINITNPYKDEIVQEDLTNDKDAYKSGHDGAFLMDGDHFLVKSNTEQIHRLGSKQDTEGFKNFVATQPVSEAPVVKIETVIKEREPVSFNNTFTFSDGVEIKTGIIRLNEQQKTALQLAVDAINNKNTKFVLKGYAGTGKSTIAKFIQLYVNTKHRGMKDIVYAAPTHKASINLLVQLIRGGVTKKPITTAKLLNKRKINGVFQPGPKHAVPYNGILIIDESSMIDNSDYKDIYDLAQNNNTTVIFMGDPAQLPPVGNSSLSPALTYTKDNEGYELTEIMRQKEDNPVLKIITGIRNNMLDIKENFNFDTEINSEGEGVNFMKNKTDFNNKILDTFTSEEYKKNPAYAKIIAYSNVAVALYNQQVFSSMNIDEAYGVGSTLMGYEQSSSDSIINNGQDYTVISNEYQESKDKLLYNEYIKNTQHTIQGKLSGWNIEVKRVFNESDTELIKTHSPQLLKSEKVFIINPRDSNNLNILMQFLAVKKAINDNTISWKYRAEASSELDSLFSKYQFPDDVLLFENEPTTMSILKKERPELFKVEADGTSKYEKLNIKAFFSKNIDYGYAVTAHKAQGSTYDNVFVDYENMDNPANDKIINYNGKPYGNERNMLRYVGLSRTSKMDYVYTNKASDVSNVAPIVKQLQEEVPDGQTGKVIVKKPEPEERNIKVDQYTFTLKPDGKIYYGNGKELTEQTIKNKVYIKKELQDGTLRVSSYNKSNYYVLSDNTILGSGVTNLAKETVSDPLTKQRILEAASLYKKSC